jgi:hypothetical protein
VDVRRLGLGLTLFVCSASGSALAAPRQIRLTLDDDASSPQPSPSHAEFPLSDETATPPRGRIIRLSLDDGRTAYGSLGRLERVAASGRRIRITLD